MLEIKITGIPETTENARRTLAQATLGTLRNTPAIELDEEEDSIEFVPRSDDEKDAAKEIDVEVQFTVSLHEYHETYQGLAENLGRAVKSVYPRHRIDCTVRPFDNAKIGHWASL